MNLVQFFVRALSGGCVSGECVHLSELDRDTIQINEGKLWQQCVCVCVYVRVCVCTCVCVCACICMCACVHVCACVHECMFVYVCACMCTCMYVYAHVCVSCTFENDLWNFGNSFFYVHTYIHTCICGFNWMY